MADNFRNKQWFKNMSQERKDEICKKFDIDEKTLRKACRETDDGRIVINLLKIDSFLHMPDEWSEYNKIIEKNKLETCEGSIDQQVEYLKFIYKLFFDTSFLKYKSSLHNDLLVNQAIKHTNYWVSEYNSEENDKDYCAYQIVMHVKSVLETDLNLIKS